MVLDERHTRKTPEFTVISPEEREMTLEYFALCERELGEFPADTFSCAEAQDMPVTGVTNPGTSLVRPDGQAFPAALDGIASCDRPSLIYRDLRNIGCASGSRIKRLSTEKSDWIYVCRKGHEVFKDEHLYSEIGLIGHNRSTGKTCFFAGRSAVTFPLTVKDERGVERDGELLAVLGRVMHAPSGPSGVAHWGVPSAPGCTQCHSHGPWLNFPFVDGRNRYAEIRWGVDEFGAAKPEPIPFTGYVEADGRPVVPVRHPGMVYDPVYPYDVLQSRLREKWPRAMRLRPDVEGAGLCTTCHQIGNRNYASRYPRSVFYFGDDLALDHPSGARNRADLYLGNVSRALRGSHNTRMLGRSWGQSAAAQVPGFPVETDAGEVITTIKDDDIHKNNRNVRRAFAAIDGCTREQESARCWQEHWTLERIKADPLRYLRDTCSYCHSKTNPNLPPLTTREEFIAGGNAWSRLKTAENPHPPGGRLEASILAILEPFFTN